MILTSDTTQSSAKSVTLPSAVGVYAEVDKFFIDVVCGIK
jgi:hypothetical protein